MTIQILKNDIATAHKLQRWTCVDKKKDNFLENSDQVRHEHTCMAQKGQFSDYKWSTAQRDRTNFKD